jgi:hypothetical protein
MVRKTSLWPIAISVVSALAMAAAPAAAQVRSVDPDRAIDGDLSGAHPAAAPAATAPAPTVAPQPASDPYTVPPPGPAPAAPAAPASNLSAVNAGTTQQQPNGTYHKDDLIGAAEGVFGKGSRGLAEMIEDILRKQGEPNGYIVGREGGGALVLGLRYGSGTLYHKIEGQRPVYWTGPSIGFDAGANAGSAFVLVYNLYDTEDLYKRFGAGEGQAYFIGGFNVSYLRRGNVVLVPVRMGAGLRLGINAGYMKFTHKQNWLPF